MKRIVGVGFAAFGLAVAGPALALNLCRGRLSAALGDRGRRLDHRVRHRRRPGLVIVLGFRGLERRYLGHLAPR